MTYKAFERSAMAAFGWLQTDETFADVIFANGRYIPRFTGTIGLTGVKYHKRGRGDFTLRDAVFVAHCLNTRSYNKDVAEAGFSPVPEAAS